jgi:inorganic phosphate transporter, PiT family
LDALTGLAILIVLALTLDFLTGVLNAPNIVATMIASRAMSPRKALFLSTVSQFLGPFLFGVAVARVVGAEVIDIHQVSLPMLFAALGSAILWTVFSWYIRVPSSVSHAQVGGMLGAAMVAVGASSIQSSGLIKVLIGLVLTGPIGVLGGYLATRLCYWFAQNATPRVNYRFNQGQWFASLGLGLAIGSNSAQRAMGMITLGLLTGGFLPRFEVQPWVILLSAATLALGNLFGGGRLVKTLGAKFYQVRPIHGFSAETASGLIIFLSSLVGGPVSTTHLTSLAIIGAGSAERVTMVRWGFVQNVMIAWILTIPITATLAVSIYFVLAQMGIR